MFIQDSEGQASISIEEHCKVSTKAFGRVGKDALGTALSTLVLVSLLLGFTASLSSIRTESKPATPPSSLSSSILASSTTRDLPRAGLVVPSVDKVLIKEIVGLEQAGRSYYGPLSVSTLDHGLPGEPNLLQGISAANATGLNVAVHGFEYPEQGNKMLLVIGISAPNGSISSLVFSDVQKEMLAPTVPGLTLSSATPVVLHGAPVGTKAERLSLVANGMKETATLVAWQEGPYVFVLEGVNAGSAPPVSLERLTSVAKQQQAAALAALSSVSKATTPASSTSLPSSPTSKLDLLSGKYLALIIVGVLVIVGMLFLMAIMIRHRRRPAQRILKKTRRNVTKQVAWLAAPSSGSAWPVSPGEPTRIVTHGLGPLTGYVFSNGTSSPAEPGVVGEHITSAEHNGATASEVDHAQESSLPTEGWYPDPLDSGNSALRWWDGHAWTSIIYRTDSNTMERSENDPLQAASSGSRKNPQS